MFRYAGPLSEYGGSGLRQRGRISIASIGVTMAEPTDHLARSECRRTSFDGYGPGDPVHARGRLPGRRPRAVAGRWSRPCSPSPGVTGDPEQALSTATYDGFDLQPLYTADDLPAGFTLARGRHPRDVGRLDRLGRAAAAHRRPIAARGERGDPGRPEQRRHLGLAVGRAGCAGRRRPAAGARRGLPRPRAGRPRRRVHWGRTPLARTSTSPASLGASAEIAGSLGLDPIGARARTGRSVDLAGAARGGRARAAVIRG